MMIKKGEIFLVGGPTGQYPEILLFCGSSPFFPVSTHQRCRKSVYGCLATSHRISSRNIGRKILFL